MLVNGCVNDGVCDVYDCVYVVVVMCGGVSDGVFDVVCDVGGVSDGCCDDVSGE